MQQEVTQSKLAFPAYGIQITYALYQAPPQAKPAC